VSIIQRIAKRLSPRPDAKAEEREAKRLEASIGFKTKTATRINRAQRRALGMTRAFTEAGGRSGWIVNPGSRARAAEEKRRGQEG
jgi:hypothetical protein